jgi:hypothetical protein
LPIFLTRLNGRITLREQFIERVPRSGTRLDYKPPVIHRDVNSRASPQLQQVEKSRRNRHHD